MTRKPRFHLPGIPQHVIQRSNNHEPCFYAEADYQHYLDHLKVALEDNHCKLHAYVLMTNHIHLLITPMTDYGVAHTMQDLGRKYVRYISEQYFRSGTLWEGRYKSCLVDSEAYLLTCMRYIELNPVRANMVPHPGDYPWSSYQQNAYGKNFPSMDPHPLYQRLGATPGECQHAYRALFRQHLDEQHLHDIRESINLELVLGREDFKDKVSEMVQRQTRPAKMGRLRAEETQGVYYVI